MPDIATDLSVSVLCHPGHLRHLGENLRSLETALAGRGVLCILFNNGADKKYIEKAESLVSGIGIKNLKTVFSRENLPIAEARNRIARACHSEWILFNDADTTFPAEYFDAVEKNAELLDKPDIWAICGGIRARDATRWGSFEAAMDLVALTGALATKKTYFFQEAANSPASVKDFYAQRQADALQRRGEDIYSLQAFNQIVRRRVFTEHGGVPPEFISADDRALAAKIWRMGKRIVFLPQAYVEHRYDFSLAQILKRKHTHGVWGQRVRRRYLGTSPAVRRLGASDFAEHYAGMVFKPPAPFKNSLSGRFYYFTTSLAYEAGRFEEMMSFSSKTNNKLNKNNAL
jgi:GT2 family glycosyltransferase